MRSDNEEQEWGTNVRVVIRRQWSDWRQDVVELEDIDELHWDFSSGGVRISGRPFIHGYISCEKISEIPHSCRHGAGPHRIKVCMVKKDQARGVFEALLKRAGSRPTPMIAPASRAGR